MKKFTIINRLKRNIFRRTNTHTDDKKYLEKMYYLVFHKKLNLDNPKTFCEKIQWLKLYDRNSDYAKMVDKNQVKDYVKSVIGNQYVIPTLGVYNTFDEIDFSKLPNEFVIKCTHDSGGLVICTNKSSFNISEAKRKINNSLKNEYWIPGREWAYKYSEKKIIVEKYMKDNQLGELRDYKFLCFNGEPKLMFIAKDRFNDSPTTFDFFDMDFNHLPIINGHPNASVVPEKPKNFELMKELAKKLSRNIPHVRVDFYECNGNVYFGELTFYHHSGFVPFEPEEWENKIGDYIILPKK